MWFNSLMSRILRSPLHFLVSKSIMLLEYTGRRSGRAFQVPVNYWQLAGPEGEKFGTTSKRGRTWWRNLRGGARVRVHVGGKTYPAQALVVEDESGVAAGLERILQAAPWVGRYLNIRLTPDGAPETEDLARAAQELVFVETEIIG